jgi:CubicO group peptidase (beta-lactamase class C family)
MPTRTVRLAGRVLLGALAGSLVVPVVDPAARPAWSAPASCAEPSAAAVSGFFDRTLPDRLARNHVPGAVVSVVAGGRTVFAKGYGTADLARGTPMDPARSLVRIASISKLFTWTAVMQQVEAGRLDLNADVNRYLTAFKVPATYPRPVTLQTLLNHTAGFEDRVIGTGARTAAEVPPLGEYLATHMPTRIRPPGLVSAYSNYGAALAGYIVSVVTGEPYDGYVQRHILDPLGMAHSTATEPVPAPLTADLAHSYNTDENPTRQVPFEFDPMTPDGSVSATATDMARFMLAHLNDGRGILSPATAARMHQPSFTADPRLGGFANGFEYRRINGHEVLMHDGSWEAFLSVLMLVPDCGLGLFVSANGTGGVDALTDVMPQFMDTFAPGDQTTPSGGRGTKPQAGFYKRTRHNESTVEKLLTLLGPARLGVAADGTVKFGGKDWKPQGDNFYVSSDGRDHMVSFVGTDGKRYLATDGPTFQLESASETPTVNLVVLLVFAVPALSALLLVRIRPKRMSGWWRAARWLAAGAALLGVAFLVALVWMLLFDSSDFLFGPPLRFKLLLLVPVVALAAAAGAVACTVPGWRSAGVLARVHQVGLLVGLAALAWFLWQWNLIGWQF